MLIKLFNVSYIRKSKSIYELLKYEAKNIGLNQNKYRI